MKIFFSYYSYNNNNNNNIIFRIQIGTRQINIFNIFFVQGMLLS